MKLMEILDQPQSKYNKGDVVTFTLPWTLRNDKPYVATGIVTGETYLDQYGRTTDPEDGDHHFLVTYIVDGQKITNPFAEATLDRFAKKHERTGRSNVAWN